MTRFLVWTLMWLGGAIMIVIVWGVVAWLMSATASYAWATLIARGVLDAAGFCFSILGFIKFWEYGRD